MSQIGKLLLCYLHTFVIVIVFLLNIFLKDCWSFLDSPRRRMQKYSLLVERILKFTLQRAEEYAGKIEEVETMLEDVSSAPKVVSDETEEVDETDNVQMRSSTEKNSKLKTALQALESGMTKLKKECEDLQLSIKILNTILTEIDEKTGEADEIFKFESLCRSLQYLDEKWRVDLGINMVTDRKVKKDKSFNASVDAIPHLKSSLKDYAHTLLLEDIMRNKSSQDQKILLFDHVLLMTKVIHRKDSSLTHQVTQEPISVEYLSIEDVEDDTVRFGRPLSFSATIRRSESGGFRLPDRDHNSAFDSKNVIKLKNENNGKAYTFQTSSPMIKQKWLDKVREARKAYKKVLDDQGEACDVENNCECDDVNGEKPSVACASGDENNSASAKVNHISDSALSVKVVADTEPSESAQAVISEGNS